MLFRSLLAGLHTGNDVGRNGLDGGVEARRARVVEFTRSEERRVGKECER